MGQWFSPRAILLSPAPGHLAMSGGILVATAWRRAAPGLYWVDPRAVAKYSIMYRTIKTYLPITSIMLRLRNPALI